MIFKVLSTTKVDFEDKMGWIQLQLFNFMLFEIRTCWNVSFIIKVKINASTMAWICFHNSTRFSLFLVLCSGLWIALSASSEKLPLEKLWVKVLTYASVFHKASVATQKWASLSLCSNYNVIKVFQRVAKFRIQAIKCKKQKKIIEK